MDTMIYVHDPMCSWCYGFEPVRRQLFDTVAGKLQIKRLLGGLAPDSEAPIPAATQAMIRQAWQRIEQVIPGTRFNHDFWHLCEPRRSTYPASRAVIAARAQGVEFDELMTARIQQAYYQQARNPSDDDTLIELASDLGLDRGRFAEDLNSAPTQSQLLAEIQSARSIGINSFPSVAVLSQGILSHIGLDYNNADAMLRQIETA